MKYKLQVQIFSDDIIRNTEAYYNSVCRGFHQFWQMVEEGENYITIQSHATREVDEETLDISPFNAIMPDLYQTNTQLFLLEV